MSLSKGKKIAVDDFYTLSFLLQADGIQLDLRGLDQIELFKTNKSSTSWAAKLGPGQSWKKVNRFLCEFVIVFDVNFV